MPFRNVTVQLVDEHDLPEGHEWALVRHKKGESEPPRKWLFVKRTATPWVMLEIAEALRKVHGRSVI